jgi:hypothetical protein
MSELSMFLLAMAAAGITAVSIRHVMKPWLEARIHDEHAFRAVLAWIVLTPSVMVLTTISMIGEWTWTVTELLLWEVILAAGWTICAVLYFVMFAAIRWTWRHLQQRKA